MTKVISLSNADAGLILLIGQVADAIFTPFIGYGCDKTNFRWYGKRKLWHLIGTLCVLLSFPFIFNKCVNCETSSHTALVLYYGAFVVVFQFGWAAVQISHLSLIPEIANKISQKVELNAIRSGLTFVCGIYVFGATWFLLGTNPEDSVNETVAPQFMYLSIIVVVTGILFSTVFHLGTKEAKGIPRPREANTDATDELLDGTSSPVHKKRHSNGKPGELSNVFDDGKDAVVIKGEDGDSLLDEKEASTDAESSESEKCRTWKEWLKTPFFYKMALIYMCTRLTLNVSSAYFVLYLTETIIFEKEAIAYFPLLVLVSGVFASVLTKILTKRIGGRFTFIIGCAAALGAFVWLFLVTTAAKKSVYAAAILMGSGCSVMLVTSLAMTADLIGSHKGSCAFVYSAMSFTDKLSSGIVIYIIQQLKPVTHSSQFTRYIQTTVPGGSCLVALICVIFFFPPDFTWKRKAFMHQVETKILEKDDEDTDNYFRDESNEVEHPVKEKASSLTNLHSSTSANLIVSKSGNGELLHDVDAPIPSLDEKLNRLSWHSSMTSYIAWRLASPHIHSPCPSPISERREGPRSESAAV